MASEQCSGQNAVVAPYSADPTGARDSTHAFIDAIKARRWITTATVGLLAAGTLASCGGNESSPSQFNPPAGAHPPAGAAPPAATITPVATTKPKPPPTSVDETDFPGNHAWIDFRGPPGTFPHYSFSDLMAGRIAPSEFTGKTVLIGKTDPHRRGLKGDVDLVDSDARGRDPRQRPVDRLGRHPAQVGGCSGGYRADPRPGCDPRGHRRAQIGPGHTGGIAWCAGSFPGRRATGLQRRVDCHRRLPDRWSRRECGGHDRGGCIHAAASTCGAREGSGRCPATPKPFSVLHQLPAQPEHVAGT